MAIRCLTARARPGGYFVRVHLDEARVDADGQPDAAYVREYVFALPPPPSVTAAAYRSGVTAEVRLLAQAELAALTPAAGTALSIEGTVL